MEGQQHQILQALQQMQQNQVQPNLVLNPVQNVPAAFSFAPAQVNANVLNYNKVGDVTIFNKAAEPLPTPFQLSNLNIKVFMDELSIKADAYGWDDIFQINVAPITQAAATINLLERHGAISIEQCQLQCGIYIDNDSRNGQNNYQVYLCLKTMIDESSKQLMIGEADKYKVSPNQCPC